LDRDAEAHFDRRQEISDQNIKNQKKFAIIKLHYSNDVVALCVDGQTRFRGDIEKYINGSQHHIFVFQSSEKLKYVTPEVDRSFSKEICELLKASGNGTGVINFVVGPKEVLITGIYKVHCLYYFFMSASLLYFHYL
jgi:sugar-specific transcriptional regulator TrmB